MSLLPVSKNLLMERIDMRADKDHKREFRVLFQKKQRSVETKSSSISFPLI